MKSVLENPTLVLNKSWNAIRVESFRRTLCKTLSRRARFLDDETYVAYSWEDWFKEFSLSIDDEDDYGYQWINATSFKVRLPEIVILTEYDKVPNMKVRLTRRNLLIRDGFRCQYSNKRLTYKTATMDHIIPRSRGGKTEWTNVVISDFKVNVKKKNRTPKEAGLKLLSVPKEPHWHPLYSYADKHRPESWKKFINTDKWNEIGYWDVELEP